MILSTLNISFHGFALRFPKRPLADVGLSFNRKNYVESGYVENNTKIKFCKKNPLNLTRGRQNTNETCVDKVGLEHIGKEKGQTSKETS